MFHIVCNFYALVFLTGRDCETGQLQLMVNFVTKGDNKELLQPLVDRITASFPQVVTNESLLPSFAWSSMSCNEEAYYGVNMCAQYQLIHLSNGS